MWSLHERAASRIIILLKDLQNDTFTENVIFLHLCKCEFRKEVPYAQSVMVLFIQRISLVKLVKG